MGRREGRCGQDADEAGARRHIVCARVRTSTQPCPGGAVESVTGERSRYGTRQRTTGCDGARCGCFAASGRRADPASASCPVEVTSVQQSMTNVRIALANNEYPSNREESVASVKRTISEAAAASAAVVCLPECFVPGY